MIAPNERTRDDARSTRRRRRDAGLTTARARERAQSSFVKAGSYDPTLVDVELTAEEAKTRANRRDAFREHLRATLAEKELVGAFAKSCTRMNEKPKDPLQWLLDYFERDQREHIRRAEETAETYRSELLRAEQERDSLIAKMDVMRQKVSNLERTVQELRDGGRKHVVGVYGGEEMPAGADAPAPAEKGERQKGEEGEEGEVGGRRRRKEKKGEERRRRARRGLHPMMSFSATRRKPSGR